MSSGDFQAGVEAWSESCITGACRRSTRPVPLPRCLGMQAVLWVKWTMDPSHSHMRRVPRLPQLEQMLAAWLATILVEATLLRRMRSAGYRRSIHLVRAVGLWPRTSLASYRVPIGIL